MNVDIRNIEINDIDNLKYQGYIWYSNDEKPEKVEGEFDKTKLTDLPFVIEGNLWAKKEQISISIKNIDGKYLITKYNLNEVSEKDMSENTINYLAHRLNDIREIKLLNIWKEEKDDKMLEGMKTLKQKATAFIGFVNS